MAFILSEIERNAKTKTTTGNALDEILLTNENIRIVAGSILN